MYRNAAPGGAPGSEAGAGAGPSDGGARQSGDVIDAEVVEEEKK